ncbi:MAG: hypothetical protein KGS72_25605 [Cyanobacteria bacterium REEB67]|nr:hypothetical protein [Cyanobacteria bacterium REEB67]
MKHLKSILLKSCAVLFCAIFSTGLSAPLWPILEEGETVFVYFFLGQSMDNLLKQAKGQTWKQIFKIEGSACTTNWLVNGQTGTVTHQFGVDTAIQLTFEKGLCLDARPSGFSVTIGMPNHHRESHQAYFRNP